MKQIIMAALLISFSWGIRAQQLQIRGKSLIYPTSLLLSLRISRFKQPIPHLSQGRRRIVKDFSRIEKVKAGDYQVSVSSIGYKTSVVSVLGLSPAYRSRYDLIGILLYILR